jgi:hypothetical protein
MLDVNAAKSQWAGTQKNTGAADVARLRGQFKCKDRQRSPAIATLLFSVYTCY